MPVTTRETRRSPRDDSVAPTESDDGDIAGHDADGQRAVYERAIDDEVYLVEPVLENGNGDARGQREKRQHRQDLCAWDDAPQQGAHDKERHGEAERHAHPTKLLALVTVGPSVAQYECHERRAEPANDQDRSDNAGRDHRGAVKRKRVVDRLGRTDLERRRDRDSGRREHRPRRNGGRNRPLPTRCQVAVRHEEEQCTQ